ncbi:hypothetical protein AGDE_14882 [Angomonas deanei]|nr:hypothetical protein AGDE_14882 [Angomonas deanei]|eukprot:EPY20054.1 hypothetical protein AGDE_14882 [Angomonas deanei]
MIAAMKRQMEVLTQENSLLRSELSTLKVSSAAESTASSGEVQSRLTQLQEEMKRMNNEWKTHAEGIAEKLQSKEQSEGASHERESQFQSQLDALTDEVQSLRKKEEEQKSTWLTVNQFLQAWGVPSAPLPKEGSSETERTQYVRALPPLKSLLQEIQESQQQLEQRVREVSSREVPSEEAAGASGALQETLQSLDKRLCEVEVLLPAGGPTEGKRSVQDRLVQVEERLQHLLNHTDGKMEGGLAMTDLAYRVSLMEETLEGLPPKSARRGTPPPEDRPASPADIQQGKRQGSLPPLAAQRHPSRHIDQPAVETLRRSVIGERSVSLAVGQEDGLRRRVAQLEENVAQLELNKVDRGELNTLEANLKESLHPHGIALRTQTVTPYVVDRKEKTTGTGRPVYVGGASVFMNDGAQRTTAAAASYSSTI